MPVTRHDIDRLLEYLPLVASFVDRCPLRDEIGKFSGFGADYSPELEQLLSELSAPVWSHSRYRSAGGASFDIPEAVARADLQQIRAMLTFIVRGERFCTGFFGKALREGQLRLILERLRQLRDALPR